MGRVFTEEEKVVNYQQVMQGNISAFNAFFHGMLERGVYLAPACYEAAFMSAAHSENDIEQTIKAAKEIFAEGLPEG